MKKLLRMMLAICTLISCENGDVTTLKNIEVTGGSLTQEVYADNTQGKEGIKFTTTGAWTSVVKPITRADASGWLSIDPASGDKAGEYSIHINLEANYTGEDRTAEIKISCGETIMTASVLQKATTKDGVIPKPRPEPSGSSVLMNETAKKSFKLVGATHEILRTNEIRVTFAGEGEEIDGKVEKAEFMVDFTNPLQQGRLQSGTYTVKNRNIPPYDNRENGECGWSKSSLGSYGDSGTVKVELAGEVYTFTINLLLETGYTDVFETLKGTFSGAPHYLNEEIRVEGITLSANQKTLELSSEVTLQATVLPENATNKNFAWSSSNTAVATVSEATNSYIVSSSYTGKLTYMNEYTDVTSVSVNKSTLTMTAGSYYDELIATVLPDNAFNKNVTWSSSNSDVVSVSERGELNARKTGTATITVTTEDGGKTATCVVTVNPLPTTGDGTFSNNNGQSIRIKRAEQWVNENDPKEVV